jgi:hypothetical protein
MYRDSMQEVNGPGSSFFQNEFNGMTYTGLQLMITT